MFRFRNKNEHIDIPDQSFVQDVPIEVSAAHPLKIRRLTKPIFYLCIAAFFIACGILGAKTQVEDASQESANIAARALFFVLAALFIVLMILTYKSKVVVKQVKGEVIAVWVRFKKRVVYLNNKQVYKGTSNFIEVQGRNCIIKVNIVGKVVYFK